MKLIEMVARIKVPKHKVFDSNYTSWNEKSLPEFSDKLLYDRESIPSSKFFNDFEKFKRRQSDRQQERIRPDMGKFDMFLCLNSEDLRLHRYHSSRGHLFIFISSCYKKK